MERSEKKTLISSLAKSPHGDLSIYVPLTVPALEQDADFFAHLVAWNARKGQVRDAKIALPLIALTDPAADSHEVYIENALAHLADLSPKMLLKGLEFARELKKGIPATAQTVKKTGRTSKIVDGHPAVPARPIRSTLIRRFVHRYLRDYESDFSVWEKTALRHRSAMKSLYAWYSEKPASFANEILFQDRPTKGAFLAVKQLSKVSPEEAAGLMLKYRLPFLTARGAAGKNLKDPSVVMALLKLATPTELVTSTKAFEALGIKNVPALRAAFEEALVAAGKSKRPGSTLKTTRAAEALEEDGESKLSGKLRALQEVQLDSISTVEGNWLVIADKSGSMSVAIDLARQISALLTRMVKGHVYITFVDESPRFIDATGKTYEELKALTSGVMAGGGTSIGCGLAYITDRKLEVDGIAIISDGGENRHPIFAQAYVDYRTKFNDPTVYFYKLSGDSDVLSRNCSAAGIDLQTFDLRGSAAVDYHSLPNLVQTMRVGRYSLIDEVLSVPLLTLDDVLDKTKNVPVVRRFLQTV